MSTEPVERLLDATASERPWSASVEAHLDAHPLPVDEAVVDRIAERLERRIRPRPSRAWLPLTVLAGLAAATTMLMLRSTASHPMSVQPEAPAKAVQIELRSEAAHVHRVGQSADLTFDGNKRRIHVRPDSTVLASEEGRAAVVLVQRGVAETEGREIPSGHWAVVGPSEQKPHSTIIFRDGDPPPDALDDAAWAEAGVQRQLEHLRWTSLPEATLETLDQLMDAP